jgi:16S rRNA processing protein RimM
MAVQGGIRTGKISKPYGLRGELHIILSPEGAEHIRTGIPLFIDLDGQRVPFFTESVEMITAGQAIIKLEFINSVEEAGKVAGCDVYSDAADAPEAGSGSEELQYLVGYTAYDRQLGELGKITACLPSEMNPVWLIDFPGKELMVPAAAEFILKIDHHTLAIYLDLPRGITDL